MLAWDANTEPNVIGYRVYVGTAPSVYSQIFDVGKVTTFTYQNGIAGRRYYFAVSAYAPGPLEGPRSSEVSTIIGSSSGGGGSTGGGEGSAVVLQPAVVSGSMVTLAWSPVGTLNVAEYLLEAGSSSGLSNLYNGSVGTVTSLSAIVRTGTYFVRVRARTLEGTTTAASNEVSFSIGSVGSVGCTAPPMTPTGMSGSIVGGLATVAWTPAHGATSYLVQAGSATGLSDVFYGDVGAGSVVSATVQPGFSAHVRVVAVNACGQSAASVEIFLQ